MPAPKPPLTPIELAIERVQNQLEWQVERARKGDRRAAEFVIKRCMSMIRFHVSRWRRPDAREDLEQAGVIGVLEAIQHFDASRGYRFVTYASRAIAQHVQAELGMQQVVPLRRGVFSRLVAARDYERVPRRAAMEEPEPVEHNLAEQLDAELVSRSVKRFGPRTHTVLIMYFGIGCESYTPFQIAKIIGCTKHDVHEIVSNATADLAALFDVVEPRS